jgi:hypothetical protein
LGSRLSNASLVKLQQSLAGICQDQVIHPYLVFVRAELIPQILTHDLQLDEFHKLFFRLDTLSIRPSNLEPQQLIDQGMRLIWRSEIGIVRACDLLEHTLLGKYGIVLYREKLCHLNEVVEIGERI